MFANRDNLADRSQCRLVLLRLMTVITITITALVSLTACRDGSSQAAATPAISPASRSITPQTRPVANIGATDFVAHAVIDPAEQTAGPKRIISMAPNLTELIWALGLGDRQVGRTQYCKYPPQAATIEVVGAVLDPNLERVLTLQPDLVLITPSPALRERLEALNLPARAMPDSSLADIFDACEHAGRLMDRPKTGTALAHSLRSEMDALQQTARRLAGDRQLKVIFVTGPLPSPPRAIWVAGPGGHLDSLLSMAGTRSTVGQIAEKAWMEITPEQVVWQQPDVIIEVREPQEMPLRTEAADAWRQLPGLQNTRIVTLDEPAMLVPGPRVNLMLAKLIDGLYAY